VKIKNNFLSFLNDINPVLTLLLLTILGIVMIGSLYYFWDYLSRVMGEDRYWLTWFLALVSLIYLELALFGALFLKSVFLGIPEREFPELMIVSILLSLAGGIFGGIVGFMPFSILIVKLITIGIHWPFHSREIILWITGVILFFVSLYGFKRTVL